MSSNLKCAMASAAVSESHPAAAALLANNTSTTPTPSKNPPSQSTSISGAPPYSRQRSSETEPQQNDPELEELIMQQLRECYKDMAMATDPYPHAAVLANQQGGPGAVFDEMNRDFVARGAHNFRQSSDVVALLFRWRRLLCKPDGITGKSSHHASKGDIHPSERCRHHYAMFDVSSTSLPSTWVRGILMFFKKQLKLCWLALEEAPTTSDHSKNEGMHTGRSTVAESSIKTFTTPPSTPEGAFTSTTISTTVTVRTVTNSPPSTASNHPTALYNSVSRPYYQQHPQGYLSANSVDLLREVVAWHFLETTCITEQREDVTITASSPTAGTTTTTTTTITTTELTRDILSRDEFQRALRLTPALVHSFQLAQTFCRDVLVTPSFSSSSSSSASRGFGTGGYPGTYRYPHRSLPADRLPHQADQLYTEILRCEFGNAEWLRYTLSMLLGSLQLLHQHEYTGDLLAELPAARVQRMMGTPQTTVKRTTLTGETTPPPPAAAAAVGASPPALRHPSLPPPRTKKTSLTTFNATSAMEALGKATPTDIFAACQKLLEWSTASETARQFTQLLTLLFIQEQCRRYFPHTYYREIVVEVLKQTQWLKTSTTEHENTNTTTATSNNRNGGVSTTPDTTAERADCFSVCGTTRFQHLADFVSHHLPRYVEALKPLAQATHSTTHYTSVILLQLCCVRYPSAKELVCPLWTRGVCRTASPHGRTRSPSLTGHSTSALRHGVGSHNSGGVPLSPRNGSNPNHHNNSLTSAGHLPSLGPRQGPSPLSPHAVAAGNALRLSIPALKSPSVVPRAGQQSHRCTSVPPSGNAEAEDDNGVSLPPIHADIPVDQTFLYHTYLALLTPLLRAHLQMDRLLQVPPSLLNAASSSTTTTAEVECTSVQSEQVRHTLLRVASAAPLFTIPVSTRLLRWRVLQLGDQPMAPYAIGTSAFQAAMGTVLQQFLHELKDTLVVTTTAPASSTAPRPPPQLGRAAPPSLEDQILALLSKVLQMDVALWALLRRTEEEMPLRPQEQGSSSDGTAPLASKTRWRGELNSLTAWKEGIHHLYAAFHHTLMSLSSTASAILSILLVNSIHQFLCKEESGNGNTKLETMLLHHRAALPPHVPLTTLPHPPARSTRSGNGQEKEDGTPGYRMMTDSAAAAMALGGLSQQLVRAESTRYSTSGDGSPPTAVVLPPPTPEKRKPPPPPFAIPIPAASPPAPGTSSDPSLPNPKQREEEKERDEDPNRITEREVGKPKRHGRPPVSRRAANAVSGAAPTRSVSSGRRKKRFLGLVITTEEELHSLLRLSRCAEMDLFFEKYQELLLARLLYYPDPMKPSIFHPLQQQQHAGAPKFKRDPNEDDVDDEEPAYERLFPTTLRRSDAESDALKRFWEGKAMEYLEEFSESNDLFDHTYKAYEQFHPLYLNYPVSTSTAPPQDPHPEYPHQCDDATSSGGKQRSTSPLPVPPTSSVQLVMSLVDWRQWKHLDSDSHHQHTTSPSFVTKSALHPKKENDTASLPQPTSAGASSSALTTQPSGLELKNLSKQPLPVPAELYSSIAGFHQDYIDATKSKKDLRFNYHTILSCFTMCFRFPSRPDSPNKGSEVLQSRPQELQLTIHAPLLVHRLLLAIAQYGVEGVTIGELAERVNAGFPAYDLATPSSTSTAAPKGREEAAEKKSPQPATLLPWPSATATGPAMEAKPLFDLLKPLVERERLLRLPPLSTTTNPFTWNELAAAATPGGGTTTTDSTVVATRLPPSMPSSDKKRGKAARAHDRTSPRRPMYTTALPDQRVAFNYKFLRSLLVQLPPCPANPSVVELEMSHWPRPRLHASFLEDGSGLGGGGAGGTGHLHNSVSKTLASGTLGGGAGSHVSPQVQAFRLEKVKIWLVQHVKSAATQRIKHEDLFAYVRRVASGEEDPTGRRTCLRESSSATGGAFLVSANVFKMAIEELIQKDLIRRGKENTQEYEYAA